MIAAPLEVLLGAELKGSSPPVGRTAEPCCYLCIIGEQNKLWMEISEMLMGFRFQPSPAQKHQYILGVSTIIIVISIWVCDNKIWKNNNNAQVYISCEAKRPICSLAGEAIQLARVAR